MVLKEIVNVHRDRCTVAVLVKVKFVVQKLAGFAREEYAF
jgi:hypothetical protein